MQDVDEMVHLLGGLRRDKGRIEEKRSNLKRLAVGHSLPGAVLGVDLGNTL